jgi:hypothetical protein
LLEVSAGDITGSIRRRWRTCRGAVSAARSEAGNAFEYAVKKPESALEGIARNPGAAG